MIICMPTIDNNGMDSRVYVHFGSAPFFTIYNTETGELKAIDNANQHHSHGTCSPMSQLDGMDVDIVISGGMGKRAVMKLNQGNIKIFLLDGETVKDAVHNFVEGRLRELTPEQACAGHGCH